MIHKVLPIIVDELNAYLKQATSRTPEDWIVLSDIVDQTGSVAFSGKNKVVCMLTGIEQERSNFNKLPTGPALRNLPIYLNIYLLFAAYFPGSYEESLKFISLVISFFQGKQVFTPQNTPGLPPGADKITVEITNLDQQAQHRLWSAIGAKMMPSISMKLRMIPITTDQILTEIPEITGINTIITPDKN
ncbi:DUF4255 domain-containing protein [Neolewinella persica]|uniref:DUF4255 domain-containing protein n=1 Tax=Neolewinella persica TaxID=70998 RepID=UPI00036B0CA4|nr:DUF4255 domain-containing protein [Neolewinella persica]